MPRHADKLTQRSLDALRRRAESDPSFTAYLLDAGQPGLGVWARRGRLRFIFVYRPPTGGRRRRMKIDDYGAITLEQARAAALDLRGKLAKRIDPQEQRAEEQRQGVRLADAVEGYLDDLRQRAETGAKRGKRSGYASARRRLERHVLSKLGSLRLQDVSAEDVRRLHRSLSDTPVEANR